MTTHQAMVTDEMVEAARQAYVKELPETALYPSQFAMRAALTAALAQAETQPVDCECTKVEQDETCPVGYPSLLCDICDGKGIVPASPVPAKREAAMVRYRHKKRGTEYEMIGIGKMQAEDWMVREFCAADEPVNGASVDMAEVAIYRSVDDGSIWVRPREEFEDGRFEALSTPSTPADGEAAIIECLAAGQPFVFDPATNFLHADDNTVEGGIRYVPAPENHTVGEPRCGVVGWPPLKKAIWDQVIAANLNGGKYISAWEMTDSIYAAALATSTEGSTDE